MANPFEIQAGTGGLRRVAIATAAAEAELYLQGAHLTKWTPRGQRPVLFLSPKSFFAAGKAIRGGVPIIFPWFGARSDGKPGPAHGFARSEEWTTESTRLLDDGNVDITLTLASSAATREFFPHDFLLRFRVTAGAELEMELETSNLSNGAFSFEAALHTYLAIGDVQKAEVSGLDGCVYIDKTDGFKRKTQNGPVRVSQETDRVYLNTRAMCTVDDPVWNRRLVIEKSGSESTVIWNPWREKSAAMADMDAESWKKMLCVETANAADNAVHLAPGAIHKMTARIRIS